MGALFNNVCYPSQDIARQNACSQFDLKNSVGENLYTNECSSVTFSEPMSICKRTNGGACTTITQPWPAMPVCDHDGGVSLSSDYFLAALAFLCIVWGGKKLIQLFDHHHADS
jgi:hypothetical protein